MERLTIDTKILFCEIAQCREMPASTVCKDGYCDQRRVYERLREYERIGDIADLTALVKARDDGRVVVHGQWIEVGDTQICSNCGEEHEWGDYRAGYCDTCGAKMDATPHD